VEEHIARGVLENARNRFFVAGAAYALLTEEATRHLIVDYEFSVSDAGFQVRPHGSEATQGTSRTVSFRRAAAKDEAHSLLEAAFQKLITDSVDAVMLFARQKGDWHILKKEPWFAFARNLRNAYSHNGRWRFEKHAIVPVRWKRYEIDRSMDGHAVRDFISYLDGTDLQGQMILYVTGIVDCRQQRTWRAPDLPVNPLL